ncbi:hypothetical protein MKW94_007622 [Papaver nudicaule]|uniref:Replication factor A C-terminal domain-containing protein n=1 Tax=Papaver nudicaule TaxID=74823 RepID=A0AA42B1K2_PAPNU|nr:hypothetical protein [Papaver nudicaule]
MLIKNGWLYLPCHRCSKKTAGEDSDLWCTKCETKVDMPIARFLVQIEVKDDTGSAVFVAVDKN